MNAQDSKEEKFAVFLCHNSEDKPAVRAIALKLVQNGMEPWLDEEQIRPGTTRQGRHFPRRGFTHRSSSPQIENKSFNCRRRVREYWVDGVLKHSLYNEVLIALGKRQIDTAVDAPWKYTVEVSDAVTSAPLNNREVSVTYDATGLLLILGEPGSGKTTTLLSSMPP